MRRTRPQTITEKILPAHPLDGEVAPSASTTTRPDGVLLSEGLFR